MNAIYTLLKLSSLLVVAAFFTQIILHYLNKKPNKIVLFMLWVMGVGSIIQELQTDRIVEGTNEIIVAPLFFLDGLNFSRLVFIIILFTSLIIFIFVLRSKNNFILLKGNKAILVGYAIYNMGIIASCIFGTKPYFSVNIVISLIIFYSLLLIIEYKFININEIIKHIQYIFLLCIYLSLLLGIFYSEWATSNYEHLIPLFTSRLSGVLPHANSLGPISVLYIIFSNISSVEKSRYKTLHLFAALLVLLWTESKTSIFILLMVWIILVLNRLQKSKNFRLVTSLVMVILPVSSFICFIISLFNANGIAYKIINQIYSLFKELSTLTGRFKIWKITLDHWRDNILFGYGPTIWGEEFRHNYGMEFAGQAHNQFVQALGESGIFGFICLLIFFSILIYYCIRLIKLTNGVSLMLVVFLLFRSITETPLRNYGISIQLLSLISILVYFSYVKTNQSNKIS